MTVEPRNIGPAGRRRPAAWAFMAALCTIMGVAMPGFPAEGSDKDAAASPTTTPSAADPRSVKARNVLETHCARCHQSTSLRRPAPAGALGDILELGRVATDPGLVAPGNADASRLYELMQRREMPFDIAHGLAKEEAPTAAEIEAVRDWIEALPPRDNACFPASRLETRDMAPTVRAALDKAAERGAAVRFVSLDHLRYACVEPARLAAYRQAVAKLLNSLSRKPEPVRPDVLGEHGTLLAFSIADLGWTAAQWDAVTAGLPLLSSQVLPAKLVERVGTQHAIVAADWLAATALHGPAYAELLAVPGKLDDLLRQLGVDRVEMQKAGKVKRIGLRRSSAGRGMRLLEMLPRAEGAVWLAYDFAGSDGRRDVFANPIDPATSSDTTGFKADAVRVIWWLPNGFPAYAVFDAEGQRLDAVPAEIELGKPLGRRGAAAASDCLGCHNMGAMSAVDELRAHAAASDSPLTKGLRDAVRSLHPPPEDWLDVFANDQKRVREAFGRAGINPNLKLAGVEIVTALAKEHTRPVSLVRAAAELGASPDELRAGVEDMTGEARILAQRLNQGALPRAEAMRLYAFVRPPKGVPTAPFAVGPTAPDLALVADKPAYKVGDLATFIVRSSSDCFLTLISVNTTGKATVVFPNDFEQDNFLAAGKVLTLPGDKSPYQLRFAQTGLERIVAICMAQSRMAEAIQQNYEHQRFTALGDWRNFVRGILEAEESDAPRPAEKADPRRGRTSRPKDAKPPRRPLLEPQTRAAITVPVH